MIFPTGEQFQYFNSGYFLLYRIIEKISAESFIEVAQKRIFESLGLKNTKFYDDINGLRKNCAFSYRTIDEGFDNMISRFDLVGSVGVYSTVEDLALWDFNFYKSK